MLVRITLSPDDQIAHIEAVDPPQAIDRRAISWSLFTKLLFAAQQVASAAGQKGNIGAISIIVEREE